MYVYKDFSCEMKEFLILQVYKGLNIITNKATKEEQRQCKHHFIDFVSPLKENSTVVDFQNAALPIVSLSVTQLLDVWTLVFLALCYVCVKQALKS